MPSPDAAYAPGDRVRVTEACAWPERYGLLGTVRLVRDDGSVLVALDAEPEREPGIGTAYFEPESVEPVAATEQAHARRLRINANNSLLDALQALWEQVPEQRFGQLIMNLQRTESGFEIDTWEWKHGAWYERIQKASETWAK